MAALALAASDLRAQASGFIVGGGLSTTLSGDDIGDGFESDGGIFVSGGMGYPINERLGFGWSLSYGERGWNETGVQKVEVDYIGIGLNISTGFTLSESAGVGLSVGPVLNLKAKCEVTDVNGTVNCDDGANINPYGVDYGIAAAGSIGYSISERFGIGVGAQYELGLRPLAQFKNGDRAGEDWEAKWRSVSVGVGISFAIGGGS